MRSGWHILEIDRINLFTISYGTITCIVAEAIFDSYDNPYETSAEPGQNDLVISFSP